MYAIVVAGLYVQGVEAGTVTDNNLQVGVGFDNFPGNRGNPDNHGIRLVFFHICQYIGSFKAAAGNQGMASIFQQFAAFRHNFLRQ